MPFVRKKSWEEHVTNRAGLQYSHDDLDVVCCHGIGLGGPSASTDISKSGRRERCSSLPGCCHQLDRLAFTAAQNVSHEELVLDGAETLAPVSGGPEYPEPLSGNHSLHGEESRSSSPEQEKGVPQSDGGSLCHLAALDQGHPSPCLAPDPVSQALVQAKNIGVEHGEDSNGLPDEVTTTKLWASVDITNPSVHLETREPIGTLPSCCDTSLEPSRDVLRCILVTGKDRAGPTANSFVKRRDMERVDSQSTPEEHRAATAVQDIMQEAPGPTGKEGQNVHHDQACTVTEVTLTDEAMGQATQGTSDHPIPISDALTGETSHEVPGGGKTAENGEFPNMDTFHQVPSSGSEDGPKMSEEGEGTLWNIDPVIEEPTDESGAGPDGQGELRVPAQEISCMVLHECDNALGPLTEVACPSPKGGVDFNAGVEGTLAVGKPKHPSVESSQTLPGSNESALRTGATNEVLPDRMQSRTETGASNATLRTGADFRLTGRKSEDGAVKLRISKKWSKEEREWSRLDSMVLLIMKLDQLDQDIEDALSATPIASDTPTPPPPSTTMPGRSEEDEDEAEAKEACDWLQAAGFPQYAQLYEDAQFPIEISSVTRDHDFLDRDAIEALCRRLDTLNKCAMMRLEISQQRKRNEDSDEDEPCAISRRWTFQRDSKRWSRLAELEERMVPAPRLQGAASAESLLTDLSEQPEVGSLHSACSSSASVANEDSLSEGLPSPPPPPLGSLSDGKKGARSKARSFLKRMESLRLRGSSSRRKKKAPVGRGLGGRLEISGPVLRGGFDEDKLRRLNCVDIASLNGRPEPVRSRSISYCTQTSSSSSGSGQSEASSSSSQSEAGSGGSSSAVSTPSPVTRARSHSTAAGSARSNGKRGGLYLEGLDLFSLGLLQDGGMADHSRHCWKESEEEEEEEEVMFFFIPEDHKPGTFPKALCNGRLRSFEDSPGGIPLRCGSARRQGSSGSLDSRLSFYDNVPQPAEEEEEVPQSTWAEGEEEGDSDSALDSASPCPSSPRQGRLGEADNGSDLDSTENALSEQDEIPPPHERRDSGVGASLTRPNRPQKLRWHSFQSSHRPSLSSMPLQIGCQSVVQMNLLQKFSLLKLTALMERNTPTNKHGFSWAVPKFMKRTKVRDPKGRSVFGVPLQVNVRRTGQPLPQGIQQAMRYLRGQCLDQVGLFRKSGVKSRIQALREMNEACSDGGVSYEGQSAYDVADMLKQYFRDLPEPLFTNKLSDTFLQIYQYLPRDQRLQAVKAATLLLPDENREALQALLYFLSDVAASVGENQMTATNLAVCLAPSLFHLNGLRKDGSSPRVMHRKQSLGKPDQKDLNENRAATHGLAHMITECKELFQVPEEMSGCRHSYAEQGLLPPQLQDLGEEDNDAGSSPGARSYLRESLDSLLKEAKDKFRGYDSCPTHERVELAYRKVQDGSPLRLWKVAVEVPAAPEEVLTRLLRDRHRWDEDLLEARVVETLDERTEVYQYVQNSMAPQPPRDHVVLRTWVTDLPKGACAVVCASVEHEGAGPAGVRANVHTSRYYLEPCGSAKTRLTHISRIDCRGHVPEWYNKAFGHLCATEVARIRDSFASQLDQ